MLSGSSGTKYGEFFAALQLTLQSLHDSFIDMLNSKAMQLE